MSTWWIKRNQNIPVNLNEQIEKGIRSVTSLA